MRVVGVIPSRWASTRLPGKSLIPLCGKPLVQWVVERARKATRLDELIVATDDERIRAAVAPLGVPVILTATDHPSGTDRIAEAIRGRKADIIINIQGDEPLIDPALIDQLAMELIQQSDWDMATVATPVTDPEDLTSRSVTKVVWNRAGQALYFSRAAIPCVRDPGRLPAGLTYYRHVGIYAYRKTFLDRMVATPPCIMEQAEGLEQLRALDLGARIKVIVAPYEGLGVDVPEDVPRAEAALRRAGLTR
jgi:3-deoxy-manno-octulosonate cytidylyltransferase (CMP-KDO synthetase)